jgi:ubiquinone/menaquinone biosynthesis C-methylase UbiE
MKRVDRVLFRLMPDIVSKRVLEPACGCAEFSVAAATHAAEVVCFDLDDKRLDPTVRQTLKLRFEIMDATAMRFPDGSFDTVVLYNAIGHLAHIAEPVLWECLRVVNTTGVVWVVSSFRMDKAVIQETLLPLLDNMELSHSTQEDSVYTYVQIRRKTNGDYY